MAIFIPPSIRDKSIRDTLQAIAREIGQGGDGAEVTVQMDEPTSATPGETGEIIYAQSSESIWIFQGTEWQRASGEDGASPVAYYSANDRDTRPTTLPPSSDEWVRAGELVDGTDYNWILWGYENEEGGLMEEGTITIPVGTVIPAADAGFPEMFDLTLTASILGGVAPDNENLFSSGNLGEAEFSIDVEQLARLEATSFTSFGFRLNDGTDITLTYPTPVDDIASINFQIRDDVTVSPSNYSVTNIITDHVTGKLIIGMSSSPAQPDGLSLDGRVVIDGTVYGGDYGTATGIATVNGFDGALLFSSNELNLGQSIFMPLTVLTEAETDQAFISRFNANTVLQTHFTEATVSNGVIEFQTRNNMNVNLNVTDNGARVNPMIIATDGSGSTFIATTIRVDAPDGIMESITFEDNLDANGIASALATAINGISDYTSSSNTNVVSYNRDTEGATTDLTLTVTTAGTANLDATDFVHVVTQQGSGNSDGFNLGDIALLRGQDGENAVLPRVDVFRLPDGMSVGEVIASYDAQTFDFSTLRSSNTGLVFRSNGGDPKVLLITVQVGGVDISVAEHYSYSYTWAKNGLTFTPNIAGQSLNRRLIIIDARDVADGGDDVFTCEVTSI